MQRDNFTFHLTSIFVCARARVRACLIAIVSKFMNSHFLTHAGGELCVYNGRDKNLEDFLQHAMKACGGLEVKLHSFLTFALDRGEWLASYPSVFPQVDSPSYSLNRRLDWPWSQSGQFGEEESVLSLPDSNFILSNP
jgi:hypothetical protein